MSDRYDPLLQLTLTKLRLLVREPEALFWVFAFPVLLALVLGIAFRDKGPEIVAVGVVQGPHADWFATAARRDTTLTVGLLPRDAARDALRNGRVALVVVPGKAEPEVAAGGVPAGWTYWYDPTRPESRLARLAVDDALQRAAGREDARPVADREMKEKGSRYIDFLVPGLIGMNLMGTGMWGIGFTIVTARSKRLLKRLVATPMKRSHYLFGQIAGRLIFLVPEVAVLLIFARFAFDVPIRGSLAVLALMVLLGAIAFSGIGLAVASRPRTVEGVSGIMNVVMLPMWIGSGVFFSTARFPKAIQPLVEALPLTPVIDGLRAVMIDGASIGAIGWELGLTAFWAIASFALALALFRWD